MDLLFLAHRLPYPPNRGDRIRSFHVLKHLASRARVHLIAFADDAAEGADVGLPRAFTDMLASVTIVPRTKSRLRGVVEALASGRPVSLAAFADPRVAAAVADVMARNPVAGVYAFSGQMAQYLPAGVATTMDFVDVDSAKFAQLAHDGSALLRPLLRREARLLGAYERAVSSRVETSLFVSAAEAALFRHGGARGRIAVVENGIDACIFDPGGVRPAVARDDLIVFTGQMDYRPNADGAAWFAREVMPRVRTRRPQACFAIVGRAPTAAVRALASDHVLVTGEVEDVRGWLAAAAVCVAPLRLARGIQNKVLEAMAMARAVVASPEAAEGIDHAGTIRTAAGAEAFADAVTALLERRADADRLGADARARVLARYDWTARLAPLDALIGLPPERSAA